MASALWSFRGLSCSQGALPPLLRVNNEHNRVQAALTGTTSVTESLVPIAAFFFIEPNHLRWVVDFVFVVTLAQVALNGATLETELAVTNTGSAAFDFQAALHSYFRCSDINKVGGIDGGLLINLLYF